MNELRGEKWWMQAVEKFSLVECDQQRIGSVIPNPWLFEKDSVRE
jgi:hypothetical protein